MKAGSTNSIRHLQDFGQSIWLDYLRRNFVAEGALGRMIDEDGLRGVTSNPAIFEKAIAGSTDYTSGLESLEQTGDHDAMSIYEHLAIEDIQAAADVLRPVYQATAGRDGYVSMEVSPYLARDTHGTIAEARRLWGEINRDNVMIKVPATPEGMPAITQLIGEGINVNITLLFDLDPYENVVEAYLAGLEQRQASGGDLSKIASVASFFVSRVDTSVDSAIAERLKTVDEAEQSQLRSLLGKVAIANAKVAYERYQARFQGSRWDALAAKGARTQRLLWASTGTKNPNYRDVMYIEELIGADTVNTVPPATLDAFRDHGEASATLQEDLASAHATLEELQQSGIVLSDLTDKLLDEGVKLFAEAFDKLLGAVEERRQNLLGRCIDRQSAVLPKALAEGVEKELETWRAEGKIRRLWRCDPTLWTGADEGSWLGWLSITDDQRAHRDRFQKLARDIRVAGLTEAVLLGMGGSSLCPDVLASTFGSRYGFAELHILDSTDPAQIRQVEEHVASHASLAETLFIVSSKSGTTLEPNILRDYFFERMKQVVGPEQVGSHFIAITDPGSKLQEVAEHDGYRQVFFGLPTIGGRYSALSDFGMVPAAITGIDVTRFLDNAETMVHSCAPSVPPAENPGVVLGAILGVAANQGRDKVTIFASPEIASMGAWLEQLLAESTGKIGKGLIPVDGEAVGPPNVYGDDRLFVYMRLESSSDPTQEAAIAALEQAGHPVIRIDVAEIYQLGQEFFRWELATAVAGSIIGIDAFDQPDVEASKDVTRELAITYEQTGTLPPETPFFTDGEVALYADPRNSAELMAAAGSSPSLTAYLKAHLDRLRVGDYWGVLAYLARDEVNEAALQRIRQPVRDSKRVATVLGFGPRFLHSTGQAYKGGPNSGVFLQITADDAEDLEIPGHRYTFGVVKAAQARGDFQVLADRGRRALRVHIRGDFQSGLEIIEDALRDALAG
ncbi:MAG: bifunctional transaldolase/phosoglucose isomerase [Chloroflexi bacterium]|nr:bifunctional transaldolase/phosoglucose isomerase [Chloroflexota bacterium]